MGYLCKCTNEKPAVEKHVSTAGIFPEKSVFIPS